jgi:tellurite resistance protein TerC
MSTESIGSPALWGGFIALILVLLALDLGVFHRKAHAVTLREAGLWSAVWIGLALLFNGWVFLAFGPVRGLEFTTGYLIEKALSVDNIFVFVMIFTYFATPAAYQHRVLFWGIVGALVLRAVFILAGGALLAKFHWMIYVFGGLLVVTGIKMLLQRNETMDPGKNPIVRAARRLIPVTPRYDGPRFFTRENGKRLATPLLLTLVAVEATDVIFAVDSIPAIFAVTRDPFIVFTSNIFAILGLRSLYFLLAGILDRFHYLKVGLSMVLVFVGFKMVLADVVKVPIGASLLVVFGLIAGAVVLSLLRPRPPAPDPVPKAASVE